MATTLTMPVVGETVTEGTIERWLKQPGDGVSKYEPIVEINTDKVDVELPSPVSGTLTEILVPEGATVPIGAALAVIEEVPGEVPADVAPPTPREEAAPASASPPVGAGDGAQRRATPRVRKLAEELGVDLARVRGTGPGGRIVESDVTAAATLLPEVGAAAAAGSAAEESVPLTAIRRTIAQRMSASAFSAPHAWLAMEADVTGLVRLREAIKAEFRQRHGVDLTYLPFMAHAVARSLPGHPYLNASWADDHIVLKGQVNLGIAMATQRGLLVPVVHDADRLGIAALARAMGNLAERARVNKLRLEDVQGGTFTLDNTGAFGSLVSQPIINQGQAAIISLETITRRPAVVGDDAIAVRSVVMLCLSFDHRILDGHQAGAFLREVKGRLETFGPDSSIE
jgi:2-oxoisovalerate dehydrogenase E2 component (dihydrolipoyl transacylase)